MPDEVINKEASVSEAIHSMYQDLIGPSGWNVTSFTDLEKIDRSGDAVEDLQTLHSVASMMLYNIRDYAPDKLAAARKMVQEYNDLANAVIEEYSGDQQNKEARKPLLERFRNVVKSLSEFMQTKASKNAEDYLYTPDKNDPSTWKLPVHDKKHMGMAAAALSSEGFRGNQVEIPASAKAAAKRKLRAMYKKMGEEVPDSLKESSGITIWKKEDGTYRWFAVFSNNYRDNDHPSEIISKEAHLAFNDAVEKGQIEYPELWHWHVPGSVWGKSDWLCFDADTGMQMASGYVLKGHEAEAEALCDYETPVGVSHGMVSTSVQYDPENKDIIKQYKSIEISDLPLWAAANKLTSFSIIKENEMAIPEAKLQYLKENGVPDEAIEGIKALNAKLAETAKESNLESKETTPVVETPAETPVTETPNQETPVTETEAAAAPTTKEIADAIAQAVQAVTTVFETKMKEMQDSFDARFNEMKTKEQTPDPTPVASLAALVAQSMRATSAKEARVNKNDALAKGPEETPPDTGKKTVVSTGNPVIDESISRIIGAK